MLEKIKESAEFILKKTKFEPHVGIILGSGLGNLVNKLNVEHELSYNDIPHLPVSTVKGHGNKLFLGTLNDVKVIVMQGRFHYYEGYSLQEVTFPVRMLKLLGIKELFLSNAAGGMNPAYKVGDLMIIEDHINLMPENPLRGKNLDELGLRFPDMSAPYDKGLMQKAKSIAEDKNIRCHIGVYASVSGPNFETRAEYRYMRAIGADAVGMSTVPEVIVARHMDIPCFAISIITDLGGMDHVEVVTHEEVLRVANEAEEKMTMIVMEMLGKNSEQ